MNKLPNSTPHPDWRDYIEKSPLYVPIAFSDSSHFYDLFYSSPKQIETYCPKCKRIQMFNRINEMHCIAFNQVFKYDNVLSFEFTCVEHNCKCQKSIFVNVEKKDDQLIFTKCGEYPSLSPRVDQIILDVFPNDAELLKKAVCCLKDGFGVGAFAYLR